MFQKPSSAFQSMNEIQRPLETLKQELQGDSSNLGNEESLWRCRKREDKNDETREREWKEKGFTVARREYKDGTRTQR